MDTRHGTTLEDSMNRHPAGRFTHLLRRPDNNLDQLAPDGCVHVAPVVEELIVDDKKARVRYLRSNCARCHQPVRAAPNGPWFTEEHVIAETP